MKIVPTILATSPAEFEIMRERAGGLSRRLHVDISDGRFTPQATITAAQVMPSPGHELDLHLMVKDAMMHVDTALSLEPSLVIIHAESDNVPLAIRRIKDLGVKAGLALLPQTSPEDVKPLLESVQHVLIFTGKLGYNGGTFDPGMLLKAAAIRAIVPGAEISVDGGVNEEAVRQSVAAGVDVAYTGGFIQNAVDPQAAYRLLELAGGEK